MFAEREKFGSDYGTVQGQGRQGWDLRTAARLHDKHVSQCRRYAIECGWCPPLLQQFAVIAVVHAVHAMYAYRCISGMPGVLEASGIRIGDVLVSINSVPVHDIPTVQQVGYNIHCATGGLQHSLLYSDFV